MSPAAKAAMNSPRVIGLAFQFCQRPAIGPTRIAASRLRADLVSRTSRCRRSASSGHGIQRPKARGFHSAFQPHSFTAKRAVQKARASGGAGYRQTPQGRQSPSGPPWRADLSAISRCDPADGRARPGRRATASAPFGGDAGDQSALTGGDEADGPPLTNLPGIIWTAERSYRRANRLC